jgi:hypothetical protein
MGGRACAYQQCLTGGCLLRQRAGRRTKSDSDRNSHANAHTYTDAHAYTSTITYTKDNSDAEGSPERAAAPVAFQMSKKKSLDIFDPVRVKDFYSLVRNM